MLRSAILVLLVAAALPAQYYKFAIDEDAVSGLPDFSSLNRGPIGPEDRIFVRDGHFYRVGPDLLPGTADDERVRFFGTNIAGYGTFLDPADAPRIARRIRRLGMNLVRLHWMDYWFGAPPEKADGLLYHRPYPELNPASVERVRALVEALKQEGIYVDLNLHVAYTFRPAVDGVPSVSPFADMSKPLHIFYPRMVDLQKEFARRLIAGLNLKDNPALAMVEISNESSMQHMFQSEWDDWEKYLLGAYRDELQKQWNEWLKTKYSSTGQVREAWGATTQDGPEMLSSAWRLELHSPAYATLEQSAAGLTVRVSNGQNWVIVKNTGFSFTTGKQYIAEVEIRADLPAGQSRNVPWMIMRDVSPWDGHAYMNLSVTRDWKKYRMVVQPKFDMQDTGRFHLSVENVEVPVYIRNASVREAGRRGLGESESLEAGNIPILSRYENGSAGLVRDYLLFLAEVDRRYVDDMKAAVREQTDALVPVTGTQIGYGGMLNYDSHKAMDWIDNHFYVDHYIFPNQPWDSRDWQQSDASSAGEGFWPLWGNAVTRQAGKPFTISEFNQPFPNSHRAESLPSTAAFGSFQDWDGLLEYNYRQDHDWYSGVVSAFSLSGDWAQWAVAGQAAWMFRTGALQPGAQRIDLPVSLSDRVNSAARKYEGDIARYLADTAGYKPETAFLYPVALAPDAAGPIPDIAKLQADPPYRAATNQLTFDKNGRRLLIHAPQAAGAIGYLNRDLVTAGAIDVELAASARGFATILLTARDGKPIPESSSLLLSIPGQMLRTQPGSDPVRPQQQVRYQSSNTWWTLEPDVAGKPSGNMAGGVTPTWMERVESWVTVHTAARSLSVYPLDGKGARMAELPPGAVQKVAGGFRIHLHAEGTAFSPWYEIAASGIEAAASHTTVNAASFARGPQARGAIASSFGTGLALREEGASLPLPATLGGASITIRDVTGAEQPAVFFYASPLQLNFFIPETVAAGLATITVSVDGRETASARVEIAEVAPGLFAKASNLAAAEYLRVKAGGARTGGNVTEEPIDLGPEGDRVYLILYATGARNRSSLGAVAAVLNGTRYPVEYCGPQGSYVGLDQVNLLLPRALAGAGEVTVALEVDGKMSNAVRVKVK